MSSKNGDDDVDIYGDLPDFSLEATLHKLETENKELSEKVTALSEKVSELEIQNKELNRLNLNLKANISSLFKTAQGEVQRKNTTINELRTEREDLFFRRQKPNRRSSRTQPSEIIRDTAQHIDGLENSNDRSKDKDGARNTKRSTRQNVSSSKVNIADVGTSKQKHDKELPKETTKGAKKNSRCSTKSSSPVIETEVRTQGGEKTLTSSQGPKETRNSTDSSQQLPRTSLSSASQGPSEPAKTAEVYRLVPREKNSLDDFQLKRSKRMEPSSSEPSTKRGPSGDGSNRNEPELTPVVTSAKMEKSANTGSKKAPNEEPRAKPTSPQSPPTTEATALPDSSSPKKRVRKATTRLYVKTRSSARLSAKLRNSMQEGSNDGGTDLSLLEALQLEEKSQPCFLNSPIPEKLSPLRDNDKSLSPLPRLSTDSTFLSSSSSTSKTSVSGMNSLLTGLLKFNQSGTSPNKSDPSTQLTAPLRKPISPSSIPKDPRRLPWSASDKEQKQGFCREALDLEVLSYEEEISHENKQSRNARVPQQEDLNRKGEISSKSDVLCKKEKLVIGRKEQSSRKEDTFRKEELSLREEKKHEEKAISRKEDTSRKEELSLREEKKHEEKAISCKEDTSRKEELSLREEKKHEERTISRKEDTSRKEESSLKEERKHEERKVSRKNDVSRKEELSLREEKKHDERTTRREEKLNDETSRKEGVPRREEKKHDDGTTRREEIKRNDDKLRKEGMFRREENKREEGTTRREENRCNAETSRKAGISRREEKKGDEETLRKESVLRKEETKEKEGTALTEEMLRKEEDRRKEMSRKVDVYRNEKNRRKEESLRKEDTVHKETPPEKTCSLSSENGKPVIVENTEKEVQEALSKQLNCISNAKKIDENDCLLLKSVKPQSNLPSSETSSPNNSGHTEGQYSDSSVLQCDFKVRRRTRVQMKIIVKTPPITPTNRSASEEVVQSAAVAPTSKIVNEVENKMTMTMTSANREENKVTQKNVQVGRKVMENRVRDVPITNEISNRITDKSPRDCHSKKAQNEVAYRDTMKQFSISNRRAVDIRRRSRSRSPLRSNFRENLPPGRSDYSHRRHSKPFRSPPRRHSRRDDPRFHALNFSRRSRSLSPRLCLQRRQEREARLPPVKLPLGKKEREIMLFGKSPDRNSPMPSPPKRPVIVTMNIRRKSTVQLEDNEKSKALPPPPKPTSLSSNCRLVHTPIDFRERYAEVFSNAGESSDSESGEISSEIDSPNSKGSDDSYRPKMKRKKIGRDESKTKSKKQCRDDDRQL